MAKQRGDGMQLDNRQWIVLGLTLVISGFLWFGPAEGPPNLYGFLVVLTVTCGVFLAGILHAFR